MIFRKARISKLDSSKVKTARIKLTAWYLLIIMVISLSFSAFIYRGVTQEFQRRLHTIERRLDLRGHGIRPSRGQAEFFIQDLEETRQRVLFVLLYTNGVIFVFSALAGYFLAGKTLKPIKNALEEQKRFVADASHEFKTPLTALITSTEVALQNKKLAIKEAKKALKDGLDEALSLKKLANDLLSLTRYQQNGSKLPFEELNIKDVVDSAVKKIEPQAAKKKIKINKKVKSVRLEADRENLEKLVTALLDNAVKYTPQKGSIYVSVKKDKRFMTLKVRDTGIGISEEDLPHIFDRFYRSDSSRSKTNAVGFGLGLSMAKRITELHNGHLSVKSKLGSGSTFVVKFPS